MVLPCFHLSRWNSAGCLLHQSPALIQLLYHLLAYFSDAEDAVRGRDGYDFYGNRLRVELAKGAGGRGRGFGGGPPPGFRPRQTGFRVLVKGLPMSASWQDLKVWSGGMELAAWHQQ